MKVRRGLVHVQHHVEYMEVWVTLLKALCVFNQRLRRPLAALRTVAAVVQITDLKDSLMVEPGTPQRNLQSGVFQNLSKR